MSHWKSIEHSIYFINLSPKSNCSSSILLITFPTVFTFPFTGERFKGVRSKSSYVSASCSVTKYSIVSVTVSIESSSFVLFGFKLLFLYSIVLVTVSIESSSFLLFGFKLLFLFSS